MSTSNDQSKPQASTQSKSSLFEINLDSLSKILTTASKLGVFAGAICVVVYSLRIGHFPQGLTVGDGVLFLIAATCFGGLYLFFVASLVSLGIFASPIIRPLVKAMIWLVNRTRKDKIRIRFEEFAPLGFISVILSFFALYFIFAFANKAPAALWNLPLLSIALYFIYSGYRASGEKIRKIGLIQDTLLDTKEKNNVSQIGAPQDLRRIQLVSLGGILTFPLLVGGVSDQLLDAAMRAANIRIENASVYVKEPYTFLLPKNQIVKDQNTPVGYVQFKNILVTLRGFGTTTVISINDNGRVRRPEIPNDFIIVVPD